MVNLKISLSLLLAGTVTFISTAPARAQLCINEVMQSNIHTVYLENEFPDSWVELYNLSDSPVNLNGWRLGASEKPKKAYTFEVDTIIAPGTHILIPCDKEENGLHTSFRVESGSGVVILYDPEGEIVDRVDHDKMYGPDIAFGRITDGGEEIAHFVTSTPGRTNDTTPSTGVTAAPIFSHTGAICSSPFTLTVSTPEETDKDVALCITYDGTEPTLAHKVEGSSAEISIDRTTVVRARLISPTSSNPLSVTHSYIFESTELPVVSITTNPEYLWSDSIGILHGEKGQDPNWAYDWRRPINIEFFLPDGNGNYSTSFNQLGETRLKGSSTRGLPQKSMVVYANKRFGTKRMDCTGVWPDKIDVTDVKSLELKSGGADFDRAHMRDPLANLIVGRNNPDVDWQAYRPAIVYFNGEFRGIFEVRERTNEDFIEANYDGLEDIDLIENWREVKAGSMDNLMTLYNKLITPGVTFEEIDSLVDFDNILPQYAINIFGSNYDSGGGNNTVMWRRLDEGAKWRLVVKDLDFWGGTYLSDNIDYDMFRRSYINLYEYSVYEGSFRYTALSYFLVKNPVASQKLLDHLIVAMGDYINPDYVSTVIDELKEELQPDYLRYMEVYFPDNFQWVGGGYWNKNIERLRDFVYKRREFMYPYLADYYGLGTTYSLNIERDGHEVRLNDIVLSRPSFEGRYYSGRELRLSTEKGFGFEVTTRTVGSAATSTKTYSDQNISLTLPATTENVTVKIYDIALGLDDITDDINDISMDIEGRTVIVNSKADIKSISAYNTAGIPVASVSGADRSLVLPSGGVFLIRVTTSTGTTTLKAAVR